MPSELLDIAGLLHGYRGQRFTPLQLMQTVLQRLRSAPDNNVWISRFSDAQLLQAATALQQRDPAAALPLHGIPFAVKDNIDLAGLPTTAACPAASYTPAESAPAVKRLLDAGAIALGKTNLDQFATGLVGTRSPYGGCRNSFDALRISGGSSSGSALAVATGLASFALGTDTAGSGRVPAAFNNLVGYKPSCGLISPRGVVPACRSLDTISVFALTASDAAIVGRVASGYDALEPYSRAAPALGETAALHLPDARWAVPLREQREFHGDEAYARCFEHTLQQLGNAGVTLVEVDLAPFLEAARLLYGGPWLAERWLAVESIWQRDPAAIWPLTREIIGQAQRYTAADAFRAQYRLAELRRLSESVWQQADGLITPTACSLYRISEVEAEPLKLNSQLGHYTNFVNLMDLAAVALPAGLTDGGLPFGITLVGKAWSDTALLSVAARWQPWLNRSAGATGLPLPPQAPPSLAPLTAGDLPGAAPATIDVAVCGAHLQGLPLNSQLTERGATLRLRTFTAPCYRFYALPGGPPQRPGLVRVSAGGGSIEVEVWSVPTAQFGSFVAGIPAPLAIGKVQLADGTAVPGFLCEQCAVNGAEDITALGGWRNWLSS